MNRIDRLFGILILLQSRKFVTAEAIASKFGISVRTVYRDIKAMCEQGIPVSFEQQRGYFIMRDYFLAPVSFTTEEANAFLLMEALVAGFADKSIKKHYTSALTKVKAVLRSSQQDKLEHLDNNILMQVPSFINHDYEYLSVIQNAISNRQIIELQYKNNNNETSARQVEPIGLIFYAFYWHLIAWCHMRKEYRDFRVSRILGIKETGQPFSKEDHMDLSDYLKMIPVCY